MITHISEEILTVNTILNSLTPGKFEWNFRYVIFKQLLMIYGWGISWEIARWSMSLDFTDDQSTSVQVMAWCRQATSHYLRQCWPRSMSPYGVTRLQCVKRNNEFSLLMLQGKILVTPWKTQHILSVEMYKGQHITQVIFMLLVTKQFFTCALWYACAYRHKQGKSEGFESCDRPIVRKRPIWVKIGDVCPVWPWNLMDDLGKQ